MTNGKHQHGLTLIEALIAFLVLSLGMLAVARLQPMLRQHADLARQRSEALRLAQDDIERLRAFAGVASSAGVRSYDEIATAERTVDAATDPAASTLYRLVRRVDAALPSGKQVAVTVDWRDRAGAVQQVSLATVIAGLDPALTGSLTLAPRGVAVRGSQARSVQIPLVAKDLGDGRSAFKPVHGGAEALVFDNRTGAVAGRCLGVAATTATHELAASDLSACTSVNGMLLSGEIRFSATTPPDPAAANDTPLPLAVALALDGPPPPIAPWCSAEAMKTVSFTWAGSLRIDAVPLAATPASLGLTDWTERGERFVAYHCVIVPPVGIARWSGGTTLVPSGWAIGAGPADWRVCRYAADLDRSGAIDANIEHPAIYQNVGGALMHQNFLVVRGNETCPADPDAAARLATVQHQP
jgi:type IV pilus modification protein PilV